MRPNELDDDVRELGRMNWWQAGTLVVSAVLAGRTNWCAVADTRDVDEALFVVDVTTGAWRLGTSWNVLKVFERRSGREGLTRRG